MEVDSRMAVVPLGKSYFGTYIATIEEIRQYQGKNSWNLPCGALQLLPWQMDFNPNSPKTSHMQVWVTISRNISN